MRESRTYGSGRGACDETRVPTATATGVHHAARRCGGRVAARGARKTTMIVALARKLLIALWRLVTTGEVPDGVELRPAA